MRKMTIWSLWLRTTSLTRFGEITSVDCDCTGVEGRHVSIRFTRHGSGTMLCIMGPPHFERNICSNILESEIDKSSVKCLGDLL